MVYLTSRARWMRFQKYTFPIANAKMIQHMSISQLDSFAASVAIAAKIVGMEFNIIEFNRITGNFNFSYKIQHRDFYEMYEDRFNEIVLFLKYIYKIDAQNKFVKEFVANGSPRKFDRLYTALVDSDFYYAFKKIKKTHELIYSFFKKIKLGNDYSHSVQYWEVLEKEKNKTN